MGDCELMVGYPTAGLPAHKSSFGYISVMITTTGDATRRALMCILRLMLLLTEAAVRIGFSLQIGTNE